MLTSVSFIPSCTVVTCPCSPTSRGSL
jgi:hypothetical protein